MGLQIQERRLSLPVGCQQRVQAGDALKYLAVPTTLAAGERHSDKEPSDRRRQHNDTVQPLSKNAKHSLFGFSWIHYLFWQ